MQQATAFGLVACAILAVGTVSCSRQAATTLAEPEPALASGVTGFQLPESGSLVLRLGNNGWFEPMSGMADGQFPEPAPFAIQTAIAAIQAPIDGGAVIAINRTGLMYLAIQNRQVLVRRIEGTEAEFTGRSVAQAWTWDGRAMILLHRNDVFEPEAIRSPAGLVLAVRADGAVALPGFDSTMGTTDQENSDLYGSPYALFPRSSDSWLVQFRLAGQEKTRTAFASWSPGQKRLDHLDRNSYETAVRPVSITEAPALLRLAAEALDGSLMIDASMPDGSQQTWLQGNADSSIAVRAVISESASLALASDGRLVLVDDYGVQETTIEQPVPQAYFRDLALLNGCFIAVWEEDLFPNLGRSGLTIMDLSMLKDGSRQPTDN